MMPSRESLPGWRQDLFGARSSLEHGETERRGLREALLDLFAGAEVLTFADLASGVRELWGPATSPQIRAQIRTLERDGNLRREGGGYVRTEDAGDELEGEA